jgi:hypothetical protein
MDWKTGPLWFVYMVATSLFVGKIATFSFLMAPIVHSILERPQASKLLRVFFPRYYRFGIACAIVALGSVVALAFLTDLVFLKYWAMGWAFVLCAEVYALKVLVFRLESLRELKDSGDPEAVKQWERGHKISVRLNVVNLLLGFIFIGLFMQRH